MGYYKDPLSDDPDPRLRALDAFLTREFTQSIHVWLANMKEHSSSKRGSTTANKLETNARESAITFARGQYGEESEQYASTVSAIQQRQFSLAMSCVRESDSDAFLTEAQVDKLNASVDSSPLGPQHPSNLALIRPTHGTMVFWEKCWANAVRLPRTRRILPRSYPPCANRLG